MKNKTRLWKIGEYEKDGKVEAFFIERLRLVKDGMDYAFGDYFAIRNGEYLVQTGYNLPYLLGLLEQDSMDIPEEEREFLSSFLDSVVF